MSKFVSHTIKVESLRKIKIHEAWRILLLPIVGATATVVHSLFFGVSILNIAVFAGMYVWVTLGLEVGFHRLFAHRAFTTC